jgi:hypothetical protein
MECQDIPAIFELYCTTRQDTVSSPCTVIGCGTPETHTWGAHHCTRCGLRECTCKLSVKCPVCRTTGVVDLATTVFAGDCVVCLEARPLVVVSTCRHAQVCVECAQRL